MKKVKIMDIVIDPSLQIREVSSYTVSDYTEALRAGSVFPPMLIDSKNRLVCGFHRFTAYKTVHGPEYEAVCEVSKFTKDADLIMEAAKDNSTHGKPLSTFEKKTVSLRLLKDHKVSAEKVSLILGVTVDRIEEWAGITVTVIGPDKEKSEMPLKRGYEHMIGKTVSSLEYKEHKRHDYGVPLRTHVNQIISILKRTDIWVEDDSILQDLLEELKKYFKNKKGA